MQIDIRQQLQSLFPSQTSSSEDTPLSISPHTPPLCSEWECIKNQPSSERPPLASYASSSDLSSLISMILNHATLSESKTNIEIVTQLLQNQMPVNKTMIQSILSSHRSNPHLPLDVLVLSQKNDCSLTEKATGELTRFTSNEPYIPNEFEQLSNELIHLFQHPELFETPDKYHSYTKAIMTFLKEECSFLPKELLSDRHMPAKESSNWNESMLPTTVAEISNEADTILPSDTLPTYSLPDSASPLEHGMLQLRSCLTALSYPTTKESTPLTALNTSPLKAAVTELFFDLISVTPNQLKKQPSAMKQFHSVTELLNKLILKADDSFPKETKEHVDKQLKSIQQATSDIPFFPEHCSYIQLPIRFNEQTVYSDLYFITDTKKTADTTPSITVLLHLTLEHLKNLDIFLHLSSPVISASFYTEDERSCDMLKQHICNLSNCFHQNGLILKSNFYTRTKQHSILSKLGEQTDSSPQINHYSFDVRT